MNSRMGQADVRIQVVPAQNDRRVQLVVGGGDRGGIGGLSEAASLALAAPVNAYPVVQVPTLTGPVADQTGNGHPT
jgi:hypothetical protein